MYMLILQDLVQAREATVFTKFGKNNNRFLNQMIRSTT